MSFVSNYQVISIFLSSETTYFRRGLETLYRMRKMAHFNFPNRKSANNEKRCIRWAVFNVFLYGWESDHSLSDLGERHSFIVTWKVLSADKRTRCNTEEKNIWQREVVFQILITQVKFFSFLKIGEMLPQELSLYT